ncbi:hypothetical protein CBL_20435 [Carabus blaptoides fortunei]
MSLDGSDFDLRWLSLCVSLDIKDTGNLVISMVLPCIFALFATINALWNGQNVQRGSGIKLSAPGNKNGTGIRGTGVKLNFTGRSGVRSTAAPDFFNSLNSSTLIAPTLPDVFSRDLHVGLVVPYKSFGYREYTKAITSAKSGLQRKLVNLFRKYDLHVHLNMKELTPSPTELETNEKCKSRAITAGGSDSAIYLGRIGCARWQCARFRNRSMDLRPGAVYETPARVEKAVACLQRG